MPRTASLKHDPRDPDERAETDGQQQPQCDVHVPQHSLPNKPKHVNRIHDIQDNT
jgi:hypothetical protein